MAAPTIREAIDHLREHYGLSMGDALALVRTPLHPIGLRDELASKALALGRAGLKDNLPAGCTWATQVAVATYAVADAMLAERLK